MKLLGLLRHAKSDWDDVALRDFDRGLNDRGRRGAQLMGAHIAQYDAKWGRILASPAERVKRTLEASGLGENGLNIPTIWEERAYLADSDTLIALIRAQGEAESGHPEPEALLLSAHNPGLQELALRLDSGQFTAGGNEDDHADQICIKYPTAAFTVLELDIKTWADCTLGCGTIIHFTRPRDLDPQLGPETL